VYFLVTLTDAGPSEASRPDHEPFIDSLIERHQVLLGGRLTRPSVLAPAAAYVLRCGSLVEAEQLAAADPLVSQGLAAPTVTEWELVAIDLLAVEAGLALLT
jgi:uncharacterized protein YciI